MLPLSAVALRQAFALRLGQLVGGGPAGVRHQEEHFYAGCRPALLSAGNLWRKDRAADLRLGRLPAVLALVKVGARVDQAKHPDQRLHRRERWKSWRDRSG